MYVRIVVLCKYRFIRWFPINYADYVSLFKAQCLADKNGVIPVSFVNIISSVIINKYLS